MERCPSCRKASGTALGRDGLCDACAGRGRYRLRVTFEEWCELRGITTDEMAAAQELAELEEWESER